LAYAVTIHKCQGATLDSALIDIGRSTFEMGQAYVALSRVKSLDSLYIYDLEVDAFRAHPKVLEFYNSLKKVRI
jgi:ATP-dependent DNA helicase PIF1